MNRRGNKLTSTANSKATTQQQLAECQARCHQMEGTLQATVAKLERSRALYDNLPSIYFSLNFTGVILSINPLGAARLGYTAEELIGRSIFSLVNITTRSQFQDAFSAWVQPSILAGNWQGAFSRSDGTLVWVNAIAGRSADPSNPEIFLVGEEIANFANQALYDSEQHFRNIFDRAAAGIVQTSISGQYLLVNQKFADLLQYTIEELHEKTFQQITEPDDWEKDRHQTNQLLAGEIASFSIEKRYLRKDGSRIWVNLNRSLVRDSAGEPKYFIGVIEDISERQAAEAALQESEQRLAAIADNVPGVFFRLIVRPNGRFSIPYVSAGLQDLIGIAAAELIAHPSQIFKQIYPDDRQNLKNAIKFSAQTLARFRYEYRVISTSGPVKWVRSIARVYRSHSGEIVFDGLVLDITARKVAEEGLQDLQAQNRALLAAIPDMMFRWSEDGTYLDYISSPQVEPLLPPSAFLGKKVQDILPAPIAEVLTTARIQAFKTGQTQVVEFQGNKQGRFIDYEVRMALLNPHEVLSLVRDITPRKQAERALQYQIQRNELILRTTLDGFFIVTLEGKIIEVNPAFCAMLGYSRLELLTLYISDLEINESPDETLRHIEKIVQMGSDRFETKHRRKDGQIVAVEINTSLAQIGEDRLFFSFCRDISDRKLSEEALRRSEARYRAIIQDQTELIARFMPDGMITFINQAFGRYFQLIPEEWIGKHYEPLVVEEDREWVARCLESLSEENPVVTVENRVVVAGEIRWTQWINRAIFDPQGNFIEIQSVGRDINDRKLSEEALRRSEARYRAIVEDQTELICRFMPDGTLTFINDAYCRYFQLIAEEWIGNRYEPLIVEDDRELVAHCLDNLSVENPVVTVEHRVVVAGEIRWMQWINRAIFDPSGNFIEFQSVGRDISDRKAAENALRESQHFIQTIADTTPVILYIYDFLEDRNIYTNRPVTDLLGYTPEQLQAMGDRFAETMLHPEDLATLPERYKRWENLTEGAVLQTEVRMKHSNGEWCYLQCHETLFSRTSDGLPKQLLGAATDITDRKRAEEALRDREQFLRILYEGIEQHIFVVDVTENGDFHYVGWNSAASRVVGKSAVECYGQTPEEVFGATIGANLRKIYTNCLVAETTITYEEYIDLLTGKNWWLVTLNPLTDERGRIYRIVGTSNNITDRKLAEEKLRQRESQLAEAQQIAHLGSWEFDVKTQTDIWSEELFRIFGLDPAQPEPTFSEHLALIYPDDRALWLENVQQITIDGKFQEYEHRIIRPNGQIRYITGQRKATLDDRDRVIRIFGTAQDITERKLAEIERDRFFNLPLDILAIAGFDGYFKRVNPAVNTILGYTEKEFLSRPFVEFIHPEDRDRTEREIAQKLSTGETTLYFENRYLCKDGSYKWLSWTAFPAIAEGLTYAVARDNTERKAAEIALRESREKYRVLFEIFPIGICITDETGNTIDVNPATEKILGISKQKQLTIQADSPEWQVVRADKTPMPRAEYPSVIGLTEKKLVENVEIGVIKQSGEIVWLSMTVAPIPLEGYGVAIAYTDITARKQAEEALRLSEKQFRSLAENTPDIIARFDRQYRHLYVNPAVTKATGLPCETFIGKTNRDLGMPEDRIVQWERSFRQILEHGCEIVNEFDFVSPRGIRYYQSRLVPEFTTEERSGNVRVESILSIAHDITDLKQMQQSLQVAQARLQYLLAKSPAIIYSCKSSGDRSATFISENIAHILGYEGREFLEDASFWRENIHPDDRDRIFANLPQMFETGHLVCDYRFRHKNGSYRWMYDEVQLVRDADGNPLEIVGSWIDITDLKLAEEQLSRFSKAVASASDGIGMTDITGASTYHNQAFLQMFGYTPEQLNADGGWQVIFAEEALARQVFDTIVQGDSWSGEVQIRNRQGRVLDILLRSYAIKDNAEIPIGLVSIYTDITERKRSLLLLQEREIRFRTLAETVTAAIFILQGNRLCYVNSAAEFLTGYTREELLMSGATLIHPQFVDFTANQVEEGFSLPYLQQQGQQRTPRCEFKLLTKTGQERWVDYSVALMEYNGQPAVLSAAFDISDRKQAEESLKYRLQLEQLIGNISTQFLNLPPDEIDTGINQALKNLGTFMEVDRTYMYIFADNERKIDRSHQWLAPGIEPKISELPNLSLNTLTAQIIRRDDTLDANDARSLGVQATILVPLAVGGSAVGAIGCDAVLAPKIWTEDHISLLRIVGEIFMTAIERRRFERELQERAAELARSNAELEQFAYIASHDLQEPLRAVMSYTQLLARRYSGQFDAKAERYMNFTVEGASRMQRLIEDLLAYSRVGTRAREFEAVDCVRSFETALANLRMAIQESGATITRSDLPTVQGDPTQLAQLLQNLIGNAIKYRGTEPPQIRVSAELLDNQWQFSISDNGIGIDPKHSDRIFQVFQRLHTREEYPGTGIGLAICKKIVERHRGRIWLDSLPGEGSTFYFTIPND